MGTLLLISLPFVAALATRKSQGERKPRARVEAGAIVLVSVALCLFVGIALNHSLAAVSMVLPVAAASAAVLVSNRKATKAWLGGSALALVGAAVLGMNFLPVFVQDDNSASWAARQQTYRTTMPLVAEMLPVGSGFGSFVPVYARAENPDTVEREYTNHAHNDYLEIALEGGAPAIMLLVALLGWWLVRCVAIWRSPGLNQFAKAGAIASAVVLIHSLVDFPARTIAISAVLAVSVSMMAEPRSRRQEEDEKHSGRAVRHLSLP
jgi:O-antigen ligase